MIVIPEWGEGHQDILLAVGSFVWVALDYPPTLSHACALPEMQESERIHHCRQCNRGSSHLPFKVFTWIRKAKGRLQSDCLSFCIVVIIGFPRVRHFRRKGIPVLR